MPDAVFSTRTAVSRVLPFEVPYDVAPMLVFLGRRTVTGIERLDGMTYARTLRLPAGPAAMRLTVTPDGVEGAFWAATASDAATCEQRARDLLDLDADPAAIDKHLGTQSSLARSVADHPGLRVAGHVDGFEVAVRAVIGQQISVSGARTLLGRMVEAYGDDFDGTVAAPGLTRLFPTPSRLAEVDPEQLPMPRSRGRAIVAVAEAMAANELVLDRAVDRAAARRALLALRGVGPWTADYIALRALGNPDVFLPGDLGVRNGLRRLGLDGDRTGVIDACSPWRSYAMMHVWQALEELPHPTPVPEGAP